MIETAPGPASPEAVETLLRHELARGDAMAETVIPILRHLLSNDVNSVFSDEIIARVRGMAEDLAVQLLDGFAAALGNADEPRDPQQVSALAGEFRDNTAFLAHLHALAMEWQLTERLHARYGLDQVVSPLVQALISSSDDSVQTLAMQTLAAQARFCQSQRRMRLPLAELPGDHLHFALLCLRAMAGDDATADAAAAQAEARVRASYDEAQTRIGMLSRLIMGMGGGAIAALSVTHGGAALFLTALGIGSGQSRDTAALSTSDGQLARLALSLRSAGMKPANVGEQFMALHPDTTLPDGFEALGADRAAAILASGGGYPGT